MVVNHYINSFLILLLLLFSCCKKSSYSSSNNNYDIESLSKLNFDDSYHKITLDNKPHFYSKKIVFKKASVFYKQDGYYTFVWELDTSKTDLNELRKWKLGLILKPKTFDNVKDRVLLEKKVKTRGVYLKLKLINGKIGVVLKNLFFSPKSIELIKFYLYNKKGKVNGNYWKIEDVTLKE